MSVALSGTKTVSHDASPELTAAALTTLLAIAIENLTIAQFNKIAQALKKVSGGHDESKTIGTVLS